MREERAQERPQRSARHQGRQERPDHVAVARVAQRSHDPGREDHEQRYPLRHVLRDPLRENEDRNEDRASADTQEPTENAHHGAQQDVHRGGPGVRRSRVIGRGRDQNLQGGHDHEKAERLAEPPRGLLSRECRAQEHSGDRAQRQVEREPEIQVALVKVGNGRDEGGRRDEGERGSLGLVLGRSQDVHEERNEQDAAAHAHEPTQGAGQQPEHEGHRIRPHGSAHRITASARAR